MKIVVFEANGKTDSLLVEEAIRSGHVKIAYVRKYESIKFRVQMWLLLFSISLPIVLM